MSRSKKKIIEFRNYALPAFFPVLLLNSDKWRISDVPSTRHHFHNCLEIGLCESESGTIEFMDKSVPFHAGNVTIIGSDISHTTYSSCGTSSKWSYIFVDMEELFYPFFPLDAISERHKLSELLHSFSIVLEREKYPDIYSLVCILIDTLQKKETNYQISTRGLMLSLTANLMNLYEKTKGTSAITPVRSNSLVIAAAFDYIRKHYMLDISNDDLANICHLSTTHFRRSFTTIMGTSPLEYLHRTRMERASVLLRTTEMPILSISEEVGYKSISSFNRQFQTIIGSTPTKWRKEMSYLHKPSIYKYAGWMVPPEIVT